MNDLFADAEKVAEACSANDDASLAVEVALLKVVSAQDVEDDGQGGVRIAQGVAPERVISVVDPEARHGHRSRRDRYDGYKLHVSVDVTSDLFVAGAATKATAGDAGVLPASTGSRPDGRGRGHRRHPLRRRRDPQGPGCQGHRPRRPRPASVGPRRFVQQGRLRGRPRRRHRHLPGGPGRHYRRQGPPREARFGASTCQVCPLASRCTKRPGGRVVTISANEALLAEARKARWGPVFRQRYRQRAQVERKNAQLKSRSSKLPWRGVTKADAWLNCAWPL